MEAPTKTQAPHDTATGIALQLRVFRALYFLIAVLFPFGCLTTGYLTRGYPAIPVSWAVTAYLGGLPIFWLPMISIKRPHLSLWKHTLIFLLGIAGLTLVGFASLAPTLIICLGFGGAC